MPSKDCSINSRVAVPAVTKKYPVLLNQNTGQNLAMPFLEPTSLALTRPATQSTNTHADGDIITAKLRKKRKKLSGKRYLL